MSEGSDRYEKSITLPNNLILKHLETKVILLQKSNIKKYRDNIFCQKRHIPYLFYYNFRFMAHSIKKNFFYNILLNISSVIFPLITAPYVSRILEPDGVGLNNFAFTYAGYFALVAVLGIPTYGVREVSKVRDDKKALSKLISEMMSIAAIITTVVSLVYLLTIAIVGQLTENYIIFLLAGFVIYLAPFKINWYYQGIENFGFITFRSLIIRTLSILLLFVLVREKSDLVLYVILNVAGGILTDIWNYVKMWKSGIRPHFTLTGLKPHLSPLLLLFSSTIAISIYTVLDTLMIGFLTDYNEVGFYSNAMHISKVLLTVVTRLSIVVVPRVSLYMKENNIEKINELMNKSFSVVSFLAFPVAIGLACVSPVFVPLFFGVKFAGSVMPLMILSMLIIFIGLNNLTGVQILIGLGFDKLFLYSVLTGTITNFLMNCFFIPFWGAIGASYASVIAETLILFVTTYFVFKHTQVRISHWQDILKALVGALVLIPVMLLMKHFLDGWLLIFAFLIVGFLSYLSMEYILRNSSINLFTSVIVSKFRKS